MNLKSSLWVAFFVLIQIPGLKLKAYQKVS